MAYDPDNIFAKILRDEAPAFRVFEDDKTLACMDVMPQTDGHTLVIPKAPAENIFELAAEDLRAVITTTQVIARAAQAAFSPEGVMVAQLNGAAAGQTVFHLHFHVIPRYEASPMALHAREMADMELLGQHAEQLRSALSELG